MLESFSTLGSRKSRGLVEDASRTVSRGSIIREDGDTKRPDSGCHMACLETLGSRRLSEFGSEEVMAVKDVGLALGSAIGAMGSGVRVG